MKTALRTLLLLFVSLSVFALAGVVILNSISKRNQNELACGVNSPLTGELDLSSDIALLGDQEIFIPRELLAYSESVNDLVLGSVANLEERWIEVDLSEQKLRAWEGDNLYLETSISSGLPRTPTPTGEFRIWIKLRATKMEGGEGAYYYNLPNVPYVMFFSNENVPAYLGYGLHGTYWHNDFGNPRSHGCVNLPTSIAEKLYYWTSPQSENQKWAIRSSDESLGTRIVIHQ